MNKDVFEKRCAEMRAKRTIRRPAQQMQTSPGKTESELATTSVSDETSTAVEGEQYLTEEEVLAILRVPLTWLRDHTTRVEPIVPHVRLAQVILFPKGEFHAFLRQNIYRTQVRPRKQKR